MERNANYALVGMASLLLFIALAVFVVWLARLQFNRDFDLYDIVFIGPVRGLSEGGEVHFNGIKVGEVTKIALDKRDPNRVIDRARVTSDVPIKTDSYATMEPQGITGINYVQITAGSPRLPLLKDTVPDNQVPVLKSQRSALSDLLEGGGTVLTRTVEALDRVNLVLSDQNIKAFSGVIADVKTVSGELAARKQMIADAQIAIHNLATASEDLEAMAQSGRTLLDGDGKRAVANAADAAEEAKKAATEARTMLEKLSGPTSEFAQNGLPQATQSLQALEEAAEAMERLVNQIQANPASLISKAPAKEIEVKP
ncbi:MAG: MCE family protein [Caulobacteraceae bacterium]|nr:MCE family protein [Caulobacteraceae bacterium]